MRHWEYSYFLPLFLSPFFYSHKHGAHSLSHLVSGPSDVKLGNAEWWKQRWGWKEGVTPHLFFGPRHRRGKCFILPGLDWNGSSPCQVLSRGNRSAKRWQHASSDRHVKYSSWGRTLTPHTTERVGLLLLSSVFTLLCMEETCPQFLVMLMVLMNKNLWRFLSKARPPLAKSGFSFTNCRGSGLHWETLSWMTARSSYLNIKYL